MISKYFKMLVSLVVFGFSAAFSTHALANQLGIKTGFQTKTDFKFGIFYAIDLNQNLRIQPEIYYSQRKYEIDIPNEWKFLPEQRDHTMDTLKYIEVPLLLKFKVNLKGPITPVLFGGGYAVFKVGERLAEINVLALLIPRNYTEMNGGIVMGAGFELALGKITLHTDLRANIGFGRWWQIDYPLPPGDSSLLYGSKSSSFSIFAGISF
jgi:hypothetical protein